MRFLACLLVFLCLATGQVHSQIPLTGAGRGAPGVGSSGGGGGTWTPATEAPNLLTWWKTTAGITGSPTLTSWADQSGGGYTLTPSVSNCTGSGTNVLFSLTSFNTRAGLTSDASIAGQCLRPSGPITVNSTNFSLFMTVAPWTATHGTINGGRLLSVCGTGQTNDYDNNSSFLVEINTAGSIQSFGNSGALSQTASIADGSYHTFGVVFNGTNVSTYLDGAIVGSAQAWTGAIGGASGASVGILNSGCSGAAGFYVGAGLAEVTLYKSVVSPSNYSTYALSTWGVPPTTTTFDPTPTTGFVNVTLSGGNLVMTGTASDGSSRSVASHSTGKYYAEFTLTAAGTALNDTSAGIANASANLATAPNSTVNTATAYAGSGTIWVNGSNPTALATGMGTGGILRVAADLTNGCIYFSYNGANWNNNGSADPTSTCGTGSVSLSGFTGPYYSYAGTMAGGGNVWTMNAGNTLYAYAVPTGYGDW